MHVTGSLLSFIGFSGLLYATIYFLKNSKGKNIKAAIYSGVIGTIFLIAGIGLVLSSLEEEDVFIPYGSIKKLQQLYLYLQQYYSPALYLA